TGAPIELVGATLVDSAGGGAFDFGCHECGNVLTGTIPSGQTVRVVGGLLSSAAVTLDDVTNNGSLVLDSSKGDYALVDGTSLTNNGSLQLLQGAGAGTRYVRVPVTNASSGTITVTSNDVRFDGGTTTTNNGMVAVGDGAGMVVSNGGTFVQSGG